MNGTLCAMPSEQSVCRVSVAGGARFVRVDAPINDPCVINAMIRVRPTFAWTSPFQCAMGHSDATSGFAGLTTLAVDERTDHPRSVKYPSVDTQIRPLVDT
jgi:hypothetical protein